MKNSHIQINRTDLHWKEKAVLCEQNSFETIRKTLDQMNHEHFCSTLVFSIPYLLDDIYLTLIKKNTPNINFGFGS